MSTSDEETPYPFQYGDRVIHPARPGIIGTLDPPHFVDGEKEPHLYVAWDDGACGQVDPANLAHAPRIASVTEADLQS